MLKNILTTKLNPSWFQTKIKIVKTIILCSKLTRNRNLVFIWIPRKMLLVSMILPYKQKSGNSPDY